MTKLHLTLIFPTILILTLTFASVNGANILFFFLGGNYSHKLSVWPFVCALANKGHNVTFFSKYSRQPESHALCDNITDLTSESINSFMKTLPPFAPLELRQAGKSDDYWQSGFEISLETCKIMMTEAKAGNDPVLEYLVYDGNFDLIINNAVVSDCGFLLAHHYNSKLIISSSTILLPWYQELFGMSSEASWIPDWSVKIPYPMGIYDRIRSFILPLYYDFYRIHSFYPQLEEYAMYAYDLNSSSVPSVRSIEQSASVVLVQTHYTSVMPRSLPPHIIEVGGMQCWQPKQKQIKEGSKLLKFLDSAKDHGAILVAFGSLVQFSQNSSAVTNNFKKLLLDTMRTFPKIKFILGGEIEAEEEALPGNLYAAKWLPQSEILSHANLRAFVTHGGLNSVTEAIQFGVPLVVIPLFVDQDYNSYHVQARKIGVGLEFQNLKKEQLVKGIKEVLSNPFYTQNMKDLSNLFNDRGPNPNPIDLAVHWTEKVLKYEGFPLLKPTNIEQAWYERYQFDLFCLIVAGFLFTVSLFCFLFVKLIRLTYYTLLHSTHSIKTKTD